MDDAAEIYQVCQSVLRDTEVIKVAARASSDVEHIGSKDAILVVIANVDQAGFEEACILKLSSPQNGDTAQILGCCPITREIKTNVEQVEQLSSGPATLEIAGQPVKACFRVSFSAIGNAGDITVVTEDVARLSDLFSEVKRLSELGGSRQTETSSDDGSWMNVYSTSVSTGKRRSVGPGPPRSDSISSFFSAVSARAIDGLPALSAAFSTFGAISRQIPAPSSSNGAVKPSSASLQTNWSGTTAATHAGQLADPLDAETKRRLDEHKELYTHQRELKVHVCSFNTNGQFCDPRYDLSSWIKPVHSPDLIIVGLQEMDLRPEVLMVRHDPHISDEWTRTILRSLNDPLSTSPRKDDDVDRRDYKRDKPYDFVTGKQLAGLWIGLFAKTSLIDAQDLCDIKTATLMTGFAGLTANKGASAVRVRLGDAHITFTNVHLAAGQEAAERRDADFADISRRLGFPVPSPAGANGIYTIGMYDSDATFFFGDLNYRLNRSIEGIHKAIAKADYISLVQDDQLRTSRAACTAFADFEEADIQFPCTYKFDRGTDHYDTSEKERKPAWTDRILWTKPEAANNVNDVIIECEEYGCVMNMRMSDHKPVFARFKITLPFTDQLKRSEILKDLKNGFGDEPS